MAERTGVSLKSRSRRSSPERRGGGGEGGLGEAFLDVREIPNPIGVGVRGRLPTLSGEGLRAGCSSGIAEASRNGD